MENNKLFDSLIEYASNGRYGFHMPGHKRNIKLLDGVDPYDIDITEIDGFDNLHDAKGVIKYSMNQVAKKLQTKKTWYLVNGSTSGLLAAISAVTNIGDSIVVGRNCHKAVYNTMEIRDLEVEYLYPTYVNEVGINGSYNPDELEDILCRKKNVKAVVITSPTYEGVISDINSIASIAHKHNAVLIVDEAHGAHLFSSKKLPEPAYKLGADLVIESTHKTLPALTQTAILHCMGDRIDIRKLEKYLSVYQSSSPSYLLMASIEKSIQYAYKQGGENIEKLLTKLEKLRENVNNLANFYCIEQVLKENEKVYLTDPTKVIIGIKTNSINGSKLSNILRKKYNFEMEMTAENYVLVMTSMCDDLEKIDELQKALTEIDGEIEKGELTNSNNVEIFKNVTSMSAYQASLNEKEEVLIDQAKERIAGDYIFLYPPGIPLLVPGEIISNKMIDHIINCKNIGLNICGLCGENAEKIRVLR